MRLATCIAVLALSLLVVGAFAAKPLHKSSFLRSRFAMAKAIENPSAPGVAGWTEVLTIIARGFIPGSGSCKDPQGTECSMKASDYATFNGKDPKKCTSDEGGISKTPNKDGVDDLSVYSAPMLFREYFRHDARCFSDSLVASYRIAAKCALLKKDTKYMVSCGFKAGFTRHYKKTIAHPIDGNCFYKSCEEQEKMAGPYKSPEFAAGADTTFALSFEGNDPCLPGASWAGVNKLMPKARVHLAESKIKIDGKKVTFTFKGQKSGFPAMEAYSYDNGKPSTLFQLANESPLFIVHDVTVARAPVTVDCSKC